jgi:hypothetical protein
VGQLTSARETTLAGNQWKEDLKPLHWNTKDSEAASGDDVTLQQRTLLDDVTLQPLEIRTFIVEFA